MVRTSCLVSTTGAALNRIVVADEEQLELLDDVEDDAVDAMDVVQSEQASDSSSVVNVEPT